MSDREYLFVRHSVFDLLHQMPGQLQAKIAKESRSYILNVNEDEYCQHLESEFRFDPLELDRDNIQVEKQYEKDVVVEDYGRRISRKKSYIRFAIPFTGERELFFLKPQTYNHNPPSAVITKNGEVHVTIENCGNADTIRTKLDQVLENIEQYITWQRTQIDSWNDRLPGLVAASFKARKDNFLNDAGVLKSLGFPLRKREGVPTTYSVPVRRKIRIERPSASNKRYEPHPVIAEETYEEILRALRNMALVMERSPSAFTEMGEEDLRMQFLVPLNGMFEADATGETFNFDGKTDILLRKDGRNLFVAECKFWAGPKQFLDTIDQLLNYLTWRDSKTAIILFVRDTSLATVLKKVPDALKAHPNFTSEGKSTEQAEFRARMKSARDAELPLDLTVQVYHVPKDEDSEPAR